MNSAPNLLDHLIALTAIRDLELLEQSLLKTMDASFAPVSLAVYHLDAAGRPFAALQMIDGQCELHSEAIVIPSPALLAIEKVQGEDSHSLEDGGNRLTCYRLLASRASNVYLVLTTRVGLAENERFLVSGFLQIYRNFCQVLHEAQTDPLTGLANRNTFDACIKKIFDVLTEGEQPVAGDRRRVSRGVFWLAMVDIDHFKTINDRFGHLYGDEVLVLLGQMLKKGFRRDDLIFRFGGEEFVLLIRCPDLDTCRRTLERFRSAVEEHDFPQVGRVTVSIGAVQFSRDTFPVTLLNYADQALYGSKSGGRNQVTFFEDMLDAGAANVEAVEAGGVELFQSGP
jgi:two-component system cell cycle response regulator